jgi:hypothetical protein
MHRMRYVKTAKKKQCVYIGCVDKGRIIRKTCAFLKILMDFSKGCTWK